MPSNGCIVALWLVRGRLTPRPGSGLTGCCWVAVWASWDAIGGQGVREASIIVAGRTTQDGFSKKLANLKAMVDVFFMWYNFCRVHQTIRMTPAMEAGWTDHIWTIKELLTA